MTQPASPVVDITLPADRADDLQAQRKAVARKLRLTADKVGELRLIKRSLDARKRDLKIRLRFEVGTRSHPLPAWSPPGKDYPTLPADAPRVVVVGAGPAGLFAALRLIERGLRPIVLERGKDASARRFDLAPILREGRIVEDSNYCFGEGGAGTFSDGKLYTRAAKRGPVADVYATLVAHGAPEEILVDAHPHIGSNLLPKVVMAIRQSILDAGGEVHFSTKVTGIRTHDDRACGVEIADGSTYDGQAVILATGHSARDIYELLHRQGIHIEAKAFALGVRIEHPQPLIDAQQYHYTRGQERPPYLPAASYRLATTIRDRGVHSFCMCPGGFIVPAATENDEVVVNGMSLSRRDSPFANSGFVVGVEPEDYQAWMGSTHPLAGVHWQKSIEQKAKELGGGGQIAPAQRVTDFLKNRTSSELLETSYFPGLQAASLHEALPEGIVRRMQEGLRFFARRIRGYAGEEAQFIGFETRTSSPVRIPRDAQTLQHQQVAGLYPCGEGAGYAGGIVSAALDGMKIAEAIAATKWTTA